VDMIIDSIDKADEHLKTIPKENQNFKEAVQTFFSDNPEPFLFPPDQK